MTSKSTTKAVASEPKPVSTKDVAKQVHAGGSYRVDEQGGLTLTEKSQTQASFRNLKKKETE